MTTAVDGFYGMGMHLLAGEDRTGIGHGGDIDASQSMLAYYPEDSLAIAYCTNGIVYRKENIINHVLRIYHGEPFGISFNRYLLAAILFLISAIAIVYIRSEVTAADTVKVYISLGIAIPLIYWLSTLVAGYLYGNYDHLKEPPYMLHSFYSRSGNFMSAIKLLISVLLGCFLIYAAKICKKANISVLPLIPHIGILVSMTGIVLCPEPHALQPLFGNLILPAILSPLLAIVCWRKQSLIHIRWSSALSFLLMLTPMLLILQRPAFPDLVYNYFGLLISFFYLGWSVWIIAFSHSLIRAIEAKKVVLL